MCAYHIVHAVGKGVHVLQFGPQHVGCEYRGGIRENPAEIPYDKVFGNPPTKPRSEHFFAPVFKVLAALEHSLLYEVLHVELARAHSRPYFRYQQADVVVHAVFYADVSRAAEPAVVARQSKRNESRVQVGHGA